MEENIVGKILYQLRTFFDGLETSRKVGLVAILAVAIFAGTGILSWAAKTRYKVLYTDLNREDSTTIARLLEEKNVSYALSEDGKTISIPEEKVEIWRLELAKKGVTFSGTVGYEIFDKQSFGTTSFVQKVNKKRALEGEVMKTIRFMKGVKRVRVHLSIPDSNPFVKEKKSPTASVVLELDAGVVLTAEEVRGIGHLVSSSVEGMRPRDVVIIDSRGQKLSENLSDDLAIETSNKLNLERKMEHKLESQIEEILQKVIGEGKVVAKVSVKMDYRSSHTTETSYDSENPAVLSEVSNSQKLLGTRPGPQGIPGARSNLPGEAPLPGVPETKSDVDKKIISKNYNIPTKVTKTIAPTAIIQHVSAAVMIDGKQIPVLDADGKPVLDSNNFPVTKYAPWTEEEINNFNDIVGSSIGLDTTRGDKIIIHNMEFVKEDLTIADEILRRKEKQEMIKNIVKYLAIGILMILFFLVVVRPFIHWITENTMESVEDFLPKTIEELEKIQGDQKLPGLEDALPQIEEKLNPEKIEGNMLKEKIITLVEENPAKAAQVVHTFIHMVDGQKDIA